MSAAPPTRAYSIEGNVLTIHNSLEDIPFTVWRDIGLLAGVTYDLPDRVIFKFRFPENIPEAERILAGALWVRRD